MREEDIKKAERGISAKFKEIVRFEDKMKDQHAPFLVRWARYFVDRWRVSIIILMAVILAGLFGMYNNQRQDFPETPVNYILITAQYRGASAQNVEKELVVPIEQAVENVEDVNKVNSTSYANYGVISAEMDIFDKDELEKRAQNMRAEIDKAVLPDDADFDIQTLEISGPAVALGLVSKDNQSREELLKYAGEIKTELLSASDDIKEIVVFPQDEFEVQIKVDSEKLARLGLSFQDLKGAVQSYLVSLPGGSVQAEDGKDKVINIKAPIREIDDLENLSFGPSRLKDFAEIERSPANKDAISFAGYLDSNGDPQSKESVYLMAYKKGDGDIIRMSEDIMAEIESLKDSGKLVSGVEIYNLYDTSIMPDESINQLVQSGFYGLILILVVLMFFIDLRTAIVIAMILPLAFLISLGVLYYIGFTLNILTLFGMILSLGILVDNAIVIAEGMMYELEKGARKRDAALTTIKKLGPAVTSATATTVVVFIPFAQMGGIMGEIMKYIPYTIIIMMLGSYFLAMSITPLFGKWLLRENPKEKTKEDLKWWHYLFLFPAVIYYGQRAINSVAKAYKKFMLASLKSLWIKVAMVPLILIIVAGGYALLFTGVLEFSQFPDVSIGSVQVDFEFPTGFPSEDKEEIVDLVHQEAIKLPHFDTYFDLFFEGMQTVYIQLDTEVDDDISDEEIEKQMQDGVTQILNDYDGDVKIKTYLSSMGPPADDYDIIINVGDEDLADLENAAEDIANFVNSKGDEIIEVENGYNANLLDSIIVDFDVDALNRSGASSLMAGGMIRSVFSEEEIGSITVREDGISDKVYIGYSDEDRDSISDLKGLPVTLTGELLDSVADVEDTRTLNSITRLDRRRSVSIRVNLSDDVNTADFQEELTDYLGIELDGSDYIAKDDSNKLSSLGLEKDAISFGGQYADVGTDVQRLMLVLLLAWIGVYIILVNQFHSYVQPALIMTAVVMAGGGVFYGLGLLPRLWGGEEMITLISGLGIVALIGIAVNDAIVFIDTFNRMRKQHQEASLSNILAKTGYLRFKPIFSTSITTILGIVPISMQDPFWRGLGIAIIGGLIFSTIGTLVFIPIFYKVGIWFWGNGYLRYKDWRNGYINKLFKTTLKTERRKSYVSKMYGKELKV